MDFRFHGMIEAIEPLRVENFDLRPSRRTLIFQCACGNEIKVRAKDKALHSGLCRRCSQVGKHSQPHPGSGRWGVRLRPYEYIYKYLCTQARLGFKTVSLTFEEFLEFTKVTTCTYCKGKIVWRPHRENQNTRYNLDRKDNTRGYAVDNLAVCCWLCNRIRGDLLSYDEMLILGPVVQQIMAARHSK